VFSTGGAELFQLQLALGGFGFASEIIDFFAGRALHFY